MTAATAPDPTGPPRPRRKRRWRRWLAVGLLLLVALRVSLPWLLPTFVNLALAGAGLRASWDSIDLSLTGLWVRLQGVRVEQRGAPAGSRPCFQAADIEVDVATTTLLDARPLVGIARIDGARLRLERTAEGELRLAGAPALAAAPPPAVPVAAAPPAPPPPLLFDLPCIVRTLDLRDLRVLVVDSADHEEEWTLDATAEDLGEPGIEAPLRVRLAGSTRLDHLDFAATVQDNEGSIAVGWQLRLAGLRLAQLPWIGALGIVPAAEQIDLVSHGKFDALALDAGERATLRLQAGLAIRGDGSETAACDALALQATLGRDGSLTGVRADVSGLRGEVTAEADGALVVAGIQLPPAAAGAGAPPAPPGAPASATAPEFALTAALLRDGRLLLHDRSGAEPLDVELRLASVEVGPFSTPLRAPPTPTRIQLEAGLPGIVDELRLREGELLAGAGGSELAVQLQCRGISLERLAPLLERLGLEPTFAGGDLQARLSAKFATAPHGGPQADIELSGLQIDGSEQQARLDLLALRAIDVDEGNRRLRIGECEVAGPHLSLQRLADGRLSVPGFRIGERPGTGSGQAEATARRQPAAPATTGEPTAADGEPWRLEVDALRWHGVELGYTDARDPGMALRLTDFELAVRGFAAGRPEPGSPPTEISLRARLPDLGRLQFDGSTTFAPALRQIDGRCELTGLTTAAVGSLTAPMGLQPATASGALTFAVHAALADDEQGARIDAELTDLRLANGVQQVVGAQRIAVVEARLDGPSPRIASVRIERPTIELQRDQEGCLLLPGCRMLAAGAAPPPAPPVAAPVPAAVVAAGGPAAPFRIAALQIDDARLDWRDAASAGTPVELSAQLALQATSLALGAGADASTFALDFAVTGTLEGGRIQGTATLDPQQLALQCEIAAASFRTGSLAGLLPPNLLLPEHGRFGASMSLQTRLHDDQSRALRVELRDCRLHDGDLRVAGFDQLLLDVPRLSPTADALHIAALQLQGGTVRLQRDPGMVTVAGLRLRAEPGAPPAPAAEPGGADAAAPATVFVVPELRIDSIDIAVDDLQLVDVRGRQRHGSLRLYTRSPWSSAASDQDVPPLPLSIRGRSGIVQEASIDIDLHLLQIQPQVEASLSLRGIDTAELLRVVPGLQSTFAEGTMQRGALTARLEATVDLHRRRPLEFPLCPIGTELRLADVRLAGDDGAPLLSVPEANVEVAAFDPITADLDVQSIEIFSPHVNAKISEHGVRALGFVLARSPAPPPPAAAAPDPGPATGAATTVRPPRFSLRQFRLAGMSVDLSDSSTTPPTLLPLSGIDFDLFDVELPRADAPRPVRFKLTATGNPVPLPKRVVSSSFLAGLVSSAASSLAGTHGEAFEQRPLLDEIALSGTLLPTRPPAGELKLSLSGFELPALQGVARGGGVEIGDGMLDAGIAVDLRGERGVAVDANLTFRHLSISEPPGGPISTWLKLPAPLDSVLFLLKNEADEHHIPLSFELAGDQISSQQIWSTAISAFGRLIAEAVARSPLRAASAITGLFGIGGGKEDLGAMQRAADFAAGEAELQGTQPLQELAALLCDDPEIVLVLTHELGQADLDHAVALASPTPDEVRAIAARLRQQQAMLLAERRDQAVRAHSAHVAADLQAAAAAAAAVRAIDERFAATTAALERTLQVIRPGADRDALRRGRMVAVELAERRLAAVRDWFAATAGPESVPRIELRPARFAAGDRTTSRVLVVPRRRLAQ